MAINTHGSNIQSVTNVQGSWVDAEQASQEKAHQEHNHVNTDAPWGTGYQPQQPPIWEDPDTQPVVINEDVKAALKRDLRIRNFPTDSLQ